MGLGSLGEVSLADPRKQVFELSAQRNKGVNPIAARRMERADILARSREPASVIFREAAETYCDENALSWKHRYARQNWLNPIVKYAYPAIGSLPLDAIEVEHIRAVIRAASKVPHTARAVPQRIETILDDATARGQRSVTARNPAEAKFHPAARRKQGDRPHAPAAFRDFKARAANSTAFSAWVSTAVRPSDALKARWDEIDLNKKLRTIPASRMKNNRKHVAPLSLLALAVLERQSKVRAGDAVFPGRAASRSTTTP
jgi:integrase